jgi:aerobic C4-dicarboxylate transport protein
MQTQELPAVRGTSRLKTPFYKLLYVRVIFAILVGGLLGWKSPAFATNEWVKALGDGFIKLIRMMIAPIIFCTVVSGIAHVRDAKKVGRIGIKALVYFEVVSSFALAIGLLIGNVLQPGANFGGKADAAAVAKFAKQAGEMKSVDFALNIIPDSVVGGFAKGDILQVLLFAILFGFALMALGERGNRVRSFIDDLAHGMFGVIGIVMKAAPIGAFGAMAYTVGKFGPQALGSLLKLVGLFYLSSALFIVLVLGLIARIIGFNIFRFLAFIKEELLVVIGTSSSESALPRLMTKLEFGGADGLLLQPGWHQYLHDPGFSVRGAGDGLSSQPARSIGHPHCRHADLEGRLGRVGRWVRDLGRHLERGQSLAGSRHGHLARHRQVHERVPSPDQHHGQWRRDDLRVLVGR